MYGAAAAVTAAVTCYNSCYLLQQLLPVTAAVTYYSSCYLLLQLLPVITLCTALLQLLQQLLPVTALCTALLQLLSTLIIFLDRDTVDTIPFLVASMMANTPETAYPALLRTLCLHILPASVG